MSERMEDPSESTQAVDPPNNTEPEANMSSMDNEPSPVDPPNNTSE